MDLVIQGADIQTPDLKQLAKLAGAHRIEQITPQAFRFPDAVPAADIAPFCEEARLDWAFVRERQALSDYGLLVADMDSTLITIECIDELAALRGIKSEVAAITEAAMRGEIDFAESLKRRVALLAGMEQSALQQVYDERVEFSPGARQLIAKSKKAGIRTLLVSGGFTFFAERVRAYLGMDFAASNMLEIENGRLSGKIAGKIVDAQAKADWLERIRTEFGVPREKVIAIGDGANDLKMMAAAGVSIAYHAKPVVRAHATYALNHVGLDGVLNLFAAS